MNNYLSFAKEAILRTDTAQECLTKLWVENDAEEGFYPFLIDTALFEDGHTAAEKICLEAMNIITSSDGIDELNLPFVIEVNYIGDEDPEGIPYTKHNAKVLWEDTTM